MKKHSLAALATALLMGFFLPFLTAAWQDSHPVQTEWPLPQTDSHYIYRGTLLNRVIALNAHLNASQSVRELGRQEADPSVSLWEDLSSFLPLALSPSESHAEAFTLAPGSYSAEYRYFEMSFTQDSLTLKIIADAETLLPLRIELTSSPETLSDHLKKHDLWSILRSYAALLSLGEAADGDTQISSILHSQTAQIRGTSFEAIATVMPSAGVLLIKLTGSVSP